MSYSNYKEAVKARAVKKFVAENNRAPTLTELTEIVKEESAKYPGVDKIGFSSFDLDGPQFRERSSAEKENKNRAALYDDHQVISNQLKKLGNQLEDSFRGFLGAINKNKRLASKVEARLDNLLLLTDNQDLFAYGIEETFDTQENIDLVNSTAAVESGYCTLARDGYQKYDLSDFSIAASVQSTKGFLTTINNNEPEALKAIDGLLWDYLVYTKYQTGRVVLSLDVVMNQPSYVGDLRLSISNIAVNNKLTITVLYSLDGSNYTAVEPAEQVLDSNSFQINIGESDVKKIRIMLSKTAADTSTVSNNQFIYVFSLDALEIFSDEYTRDQQSVLYAGPYEITDENNNPVYFSKATIDACVIQGEDTSINFYLSQDNSTWYPVSYTGQSVGVVTFSSADFEVSRAAVDDSQGFDVILDAPVFLSVASATDAVLNTAISSAYKDKYSNNTLVLKRNVVSTGTPYGVASGWFFDQDKQLYRTTVHVTQPDGTGIDFGDSGVFVNGVLRTGMVLLLPGYTVIETNSLNWKEVPSGLRTEEEVKTEDPLYPYNHRYLIEGYSYDNDFVGRKIYSGVEEYFGIKMRYVSPEEFELDSNKKNLEIFTIDRDFGISYLKVKANKNDTSWNTERYNVKWNISDSGSNVLYVKAELETSDATNSPKIDHYKVRVI